MLPWKRETNPDACLAPMKQREFPSWLKNENYMVHGSPVGIGDGKEKEKEGAGGRGRQGAKKVSQIN